MVLQQLYAYLIHLLAGLGVVGAFVLVYLHVTPFRELHLIRNGGVAAALSLGGATLGFALTVASSILHNDSFLMFLFWAACSAAVQVLPGPEAFELCCYFGFLARGRTGSACSHWAAGGTGQRR